jgi:hypothetical protein
MNVAVRVAVVIAAFVAALAGVARADDDESLSPKWEADIGFRAPGMLEVGLWKPIDLGFEALGGVRFGRLTMLVEGSYDALWPAGWTHGSIDINSNDEVSGSMLRVALVGRYMFARYLGDWGKHEERSLNGFFVDTAVGEERIRIDGAAAFSRPDFTLGLGVSNGVEFDKQKRTRFAAYYSFDVTWAPAAATPQIACFGTCPSYPGTGQRDIGWTFNLGVLFGG